MQTSKYKERIYNTSEVICFRKTKEIFGGLSNMAAGFPIKINNISILTSEALYQACRFPHLPEVQKKIINEKSPMTAKMLSKPYRDKTRGDFEEIKIDIMRWCLRVKLAQNFVNFSKLLISTQDKPIVEDSSKDTFWGAVRDKKDKEILKGINALGRLLMELRQQYIEDPFSIKLLYIEPPKIRNFILFNESIGVVDERKKFMNYIAKQYSLSISFYNPNNLYQYKSELITVSEPNNEKIINNETSTTVEKQKKIKNKTKKSNSAKQDPTLFN